MTEEKKTVSSALTETMQQLLVQQFTEEQQEEYKNLLKCVASAYTKTENAYLSMAFSLFHIYSNQYYILDGYKNIYELAKDRFSLSRGTVNNYINIVREFGLWDLDERGINCFQNKLSPTYKKYTVSKLVILLTMTPIVRSLASPDMTVKQLKDLRREHTDEDAAIETDATIIDSEELEGPEESETLASCLNAPCFDDILIAMVDDVINLDTEEQDIVTEAFQRMQHAYPDHKVMYKISLFIE